MSGTINGAYRSAVIPQNWMVHECNGVTGWRETNIGDGAGALVQNLADGKFEPAAAIDIVHHREFVRGWVPIGPADIFQHFPRRSTGQGGLRQSPSSVVKK